MFDPQVLLQQVLGGNNDDEKGNRKRGVSTDTIKGAALGGLAGLLLGSKAGRKLGSSALKVGGVAVLGGLAYKAWQNWQEQQSGQQATTIRPAGSAEGTTFLPSQNAERNELSLTLLSAMISAAKSDGHIDATEQDRIFVKIDKSDLSADEKGFLMDQIRKPLDLDALAARATTPERAAEIYAASMLVIDADTPEETEYLNKLASRLKLDVNLRRNIEAEVRSATEPG